MLRIKMHAMYDHFPDHNPAPGEPYVHCYSDTYVKEITPGQKAFALLLEPRSLIPDAYDFVQANPEHFRYILTHDSRLLKLENARLFLWGDVWCRTDSEKTKGISLVSSWKDWCPLHHARLTLARHFDGGGLVDCFGSFKGDKDHWDDVRTAHEAYRFAIVIENDIDELWFTEKILNCFSNKVVPIYVGATRIGDFFNTDGIIRVDDWRNIPEIVKHLDIETEYEKRKEAINDNFERCRPFEVKWKDRFFYDYGAMLEEVQNGL